MSKYIDADKLIHDLEERIFAYSEGYAEGDDNRKDAIETLLKDVKYQYSLQEDEPEVDFEKEVEHYLLTNSNLIVEKDSKWVVNAIARHFYELGKLNTRKEENK